jgi:hypothetical protein
MNVYLMAGAVILACVLIYFLAKRRLMAAHYAIQKLEKEKQKVQREVLQLQKDKIDLLKVMDMDPPKRESSF